MPHLLYSQQYLPPSSDAMLIASMLLYCVQTVSAVLYEPEKVTATHAPGVFARL